MNSFTLTAIGNLARDPQMMSKGDSLYTRFRLIGNDYAGKDADGNRRRITLEVNFVAFGGIAEAIALHTRKGDQLIVLAHMRSSEKSERTDGRHPEHSWIVRDFRFGAPGKLKRNEFAERDRKNAESETDVARTGTEDLGAESPEPEVADVTF